jgi:hypothetical protein
LAKGTGETMIEAAVSIIDEIKQGE